MVSVSSSPRYSVCRWARFGAVAVVQVVIATVELDAPPISITKLTMVLKELFYYY